MIGQLSRETTLPILEENHKRTLTDHKSSIKKADAFAGNASQQQATTSHLQC